MCRSCARCALARHSSLFLSAITLHELELAVLLAERRDPTQGALLRHWLQQAVVPAVAGRILAVDAAVTLRSADCMGPTPSRFVMA